MPNDDLKTAKFKVLPATGATLSRRLRGLVPWRATPGDYKWCMERIGFKVVKWDSERLTRERFNAPVRPRKAA